jgi:starch synthase (maltosyl-transferring)
MVTKATPKSRRSHNKTSLASYVPKGHVLVERVWPQLDCGRYRVKAVAGDEVEVSADIVRDGPDLLCAVVRYRAPDDARWREAPMTFVDNDRWAGAFVPTVVGRYEYCIQAWTDHFSTWRRDLLKRVDAGQDVRTELEEGARLLDAHLPLIPSRRRGAIQRAVEVPRETTASVAECVDAVTDEQVVVLMRKHSDRADATTTPALELTVDRERARFGAWYEFFPRSTGAAGRHGTFKSAAARLDAIAQMGFDVVYLPPIHPIGEVNRKGKNHALAVQRGDIGSPWAIGSRHGGHTSTHPDLGTLEDFDDFVAHAHRVGLEVCLDYAIQCSPDHPWVSQHPEWFHHRPDGTIKYAENPPKKYQDIYPINFDTQDKEGLWTELKGVLDFWIERGVKIFRVDNPHTKAFAFWEWAIESLKADHPDLILLSEAFTRPKVMQTLAKIGFTQSYTYFTWRNTKWELTEYLTELSRSEMVYYFRPNFFANTPDILHAYLQDGGPPAFKIRLVLAALLSPSYGIYSGYEFFENIAMAPGSEEYLNSEKFELRHRDFDASGSLAPYIARINEIRHKHPSLSLFANLHFHQTDKDHLLAFSKSSPEDTVLVIVNLNPFHWEEGTINVDLDALRIGDHARPYEVHDLITETTYLWHGSHNYVRLDPDEPAHIFEVRI